MEYLRLGDLARFRRDHGRFTEISTSAIMRQVLEGIRHMHDINFAHRDLKPAVRRTLHLRFICLYLYRIS
jgi:serine/threonine protein kinase